MWVSGSSLLQGMFVSTSEFPGVLSVLAYFVCRLAGVLATCQIILKTPILRTDDPSSQHRDGGIAGVQNSTKANQSNDVWAVGDNGNPNATQSLVLYYHNGSWSTVTSA